MSKILIEDITFYNNVRVIDTRHYQDQFLKRNIDLTTNDIKLIFERGIDTLKGYAENGMFYLIYSKEFNQGVVIKYKKGKKHDIIVIVTFLPRGRKQPKDDTERIIVENNIICMDNECLVYLNEIFNDVKETNTSTIIESYINNFNFNFYFLDGKIYDITNLEVIEVV